MSVSVIIPNFNNEKYIKRCIESVLSQSFLPDEVIIVDDCSTDSSKEIINELAECSPLIKPFFLDENRGVSHARNYGIKQSNSNFITFLDADDFYYNDKKLENEYLLLEKHSFNAAVYSKLVFCNESGEIIKKLDYPEKDYFQGDIFFPLLAERITRTLMRDFVFPKSVIDDNTLFDEDNCLFEDYDFLIKLSKKIEFFCTFQYGTAYRQKESGLSHRTDEELRNSKNSIIRKYTDLLNNDQMKMLKKEKNKKLLDRIGFKLRGE